MPTLPLAPFSWTALGEGPWSVPPIETVEGLPTDCEFAVVGAGISGLSCALALSAAGRDVVVVDRQFGAGATCRSGGIVVGDTLVGPSPAFERCEFELRAWIERESAACALEWTGCQELDREPAQAPGTNGWQDGGAMRVSGVVPGGLVDPAALVARVAEAAIARGARVVDRVVIDRCSREGERVVLRGPAGQLAASRAIVAVDATGGVGRLDPWPQRLLTVVLETDPIADDLAAAIGWRERLPFYTNDLPLLWGRPMPGGGMLAGRELITAEIDDEAALRAAIQRAGSRLTERIRGLHPALAAIGVRRVWAGPIARDTAGVPGIVADADVPGLWRIGGYGGHGLAQAFRLGALAAGLLLRGGSVPQS